MLIKLQGPLLIFHNLLQQQKNRQGLIGCTSEGGFVNVDGHLIVEGSAVCVKTKLDNVWQDTNKQHNFKLKMVLTISPSIASLSLSHTHTQRESSLKPSYNLGWDQYWGDVCQSFLFCVCFFCLKIVLKRLSFNTSSATTSTHLINKNILWGSIVIIYVLYVG